MVVSLLVIFGLYAALADRYFPIPIVMAWKAL